MSLLVFVVGPVLLCVCSVYEFLILTQKHNMSALLEIVTNTVAFVTYFFLFATRKTRVVATWFCLD